MGNMETKEQLVFSGAMLGKDMRRVMLSCARLLRNWILVNNPEDSARLERWARELEARGARPERLA
jgi:hypothetical protein